MVLLRIDERLPESPLESEVVLHVRRHARAAVRRRAPEAPASLALLFGFDADGAVEWDNAARTHDPMQAGARIAHKRRGLKELVVSLGHEAAHVELCKQWLAARKDLDDTFSKIAASDIATLLELSKARDLAHAKGVDALGNERFLPILIQGPTGSGKELLALALHDLWLRALQKTKVPYQVVHVGGMTADLISDELFGHAKGGFTGAAKDRPGRIEAANEGTLLIDEVGDLPAEAQVRLLRFLQTQVISRIGENKERALSVRVIAATWHDLDQDVADGKFREDLLYRLRVGAGLRLPSLKQREGFFDEMLPELLRKRCHGGSPLITRAARDALERHGWPGNLRELTGVLDEVIALAKGDTIRLEHLPSHLQRGYLELPLHRRAVGFLLDEVDGGGLPEDHVGWRIDEVNRSLASAPLPPANEELTRVGGFLSLLDDSSTDHRRDVDEVNELLRVDQQYRLASVARSFWQSVLSIDAPENLRQLFRGASDRAEDREKDLHQQLLNGHLQARIESNAWLRLLLEVQELPLMRGANRGELASTFVSAFNLVKLISPSLMDEIRADAAAGGFNSIRERIVRFFRDARAEESDLLEVQDGVHHQPGQLSREEWASITLQFPTQRAASDATGFDPKTIAKYLKKHGIVNPWKARRSS